MPSDSLKTHHHRLLFKEAEVICRIFAQKYKLPVDNVLEYGLAHILKEHPELKGHILPDPIEINALSLPELKQECRIRKIKVTGSRDILRNRILHEIHRIRLISEKIEDIPD
jgi:hypothetical protein